MTKYWVNIEIILNLLYQYLFQICIEKYTIEKTTIVSKKPISNIRDVKLIGWLYPGPEFTIMRDHLLEITISIKNYKECSLLLKDSNIQFYNNTHVCGLPKVKGQKLTSVSKLIKIVVYSFFNSIHSRFPITRFPVTRPPFYERVTPPHNEQTIDLSSPTTTE